MYIISNYNLDNKLMKKSQKITVIIMIILGIFLIVNQIINDFKFNL